MQEQPEIQYYTQHHQQTSVHKKSTIWLEAIEKLSAKCILIGLSGHKKDC